MWYQTQKMEENETIRQIHYHVTDVDEKIVHHNLTYQLTSLSLTKIKIVFIQVFVGTLTSNVIHSLELVVNL